MDQTDQLCTERAPCMATAQSAGTLPTAALILTYSLSSMEAPSAPPQTWKHQFLWHQQKPTPNFATGSSNFSAHTDRTMIFVTLLFSPTLRWILQARTHRILQTCCAERKQRKYKCIRWEMNQRCEPFTGIAESTARLKHASWSQYARNSTQNNCFGKKLLNMKHHLALGGDNKPVVTDAWSTNRKHVLLMEVLSSVWRNHDSSALKNCLQQEEQIVWHL